MDNPYQPMSVTWEPWKKIEGNINADRVYPIYAYNQLFVFWADTRLEEVQELHGEGGIGNARRVNRKWLHLQVYFSFLNTRGEWATPQKIDGEGKKRYLRTEINAHVLEYARNKSWLIPGAGPLKPIRMRVKPLSNSNEISVHFGEYDILNPNVRNNRQAIERELYEATKGQEGDGYHAGMVCLADSLENLTLKKDLSIHKIPVNSPYHWDQGSIDHKIINSNHSLPVGSERYYTYENEKGDAFLVRKGVTNEQNYSVIRLNTNTVLEFRQTLFAKGVAGLMNPEAQKVKEIPTWDQVIRNQESITPLSTPEFLEYDGAYGLYYWELFYHAPFYIAQALRNRQKFDDAMRWYQYVCNPSSSEVWQFIPFQKKKELDLLGNIREKSDNYAYIEPKNAEVKTPPWITTMATRKDSRQISPFVPPVLKMEEHPSAIPMVNFDGNHAVVCGNYLQNYNFPELTVQAQICVQEANRESTGVIFSYGNLTLEDSSAGSGFILYYSKGKVYGRVEQTKNNQTKTYKVEIPFDRYDEIREITLVWYQNRIFLYSNDYLNENDQKAVATDILKIDVDAPLLIGTDAVKNSYFQGMIRNVLVWNRARNKMEIDNHNKQLHEPSGLRITGMENGLLGYWQLTGDQKRVWDQDCKCASNLCEKSGMIAYAYFQDIRLMDWKSNRLIKNLFVQEMHPFMLELSGDGKFLLCSGDNRSVYLWALEGFKKIPVPQNQCFYDRFIQFSPDSQRFAFNEEKGIKILKTSNPKEQIVFTFEYEARTLCFSPDSQRIAVGDIGGNIVIRDIETGESKFDSKKNNGKITTLKFSADGEFLASIHDREFINIWKVKTGEKIKAINGIGRVDTLCFSEDGKFLLIPSDKERFPIFVWSTETWEKMYQIDTNGIDWAFGMNFINDGKSLYYWSACLAHTLELDPANILLPNKATPPKAREHQSAIERYQRDPFEPHRIAQLRPLAYKKSIMMHYIGNLLDWGDNYFRQNTRDSIMDAQMLYMRAYNLLGKTPVDLGELPEPTPKTLQNFMDEEVRGVGADDEFIELENDIAEDADITEFEVPYNYIPGLYFRFPENSLFTQYWDRVQDRLYKIRNSLDFYGKKQTLPLFEAPIDPMALVNAQAAGGTAGLAAQMQTTLPHYRFNFILEKAKAYTDRVIQLGNALLAALEKQDSAELAHMQQNNSRTILDMTRQMKQDQINQARANLDAIRKSKITAETRHDHYKTLIANNWSEMEKVQVGTMVLSQIAAGVASITGFVGGAAALVPNAGSPFAMTWGGKQMQASLARWSNSLKIGAEVLDSVSKSTGLIASWDRRFQEWEFQQKMAEKDIIQIDAQIQASEFQQKIAERDLEVLEKNIDQEESIERFMKNKFTNQELYDWMSQKLIGIYSQAYQMANDLALQAQKALQFELTMDDSTTFINGTYWDNLKKGLLAGESLILDLERMEKAWLERNERRLEISKTISLLQLDPKALFELRTKGSCRFSLTEKLFDYDFPGHYARQIKTVSLTFPAVIGPYQNFNASLTQLTHRTLLKPDSNDAKVLLTGEGEVTTAIRQDWRQNQQVALSRGVNDSGLFQLNYQDERYLPFEGTGVVSDWELELSTFHDLDLESLSDVIVKVEYTALADEGKFKQDVEKALEKIQGEDPQTRCFMMTGEFSGNWRELLAQKSTTVNLPKTMFPKRENLKIDTLHVILDFAETADSSVTMEIAPGTKPKESKAFSRETPIQELAEINSMFQQDTFPITFTLTEGAATFTEENIRNMIFFVTYKGKMVR